MLTKQIFCIRKNGESSNLIQRIEKRENQNDTNKYHKWTCVFYSLDALKKRVLVGRVRKVFLQKEAFVARRLT